MTQEQVFFWINKKIGNFLPCEGNNDVIILSICFKFNAFILHNWVVKDNNMINLLLHRSWATRISMY